VVEVIFAELCTADEIVCFESDYKDLPQSVPCSICRTPHKKGYIAVVRSGARTRIGHICGRSLLGDLRFEQMESELGIRQQRARREQIITNPDFDPRAALEALQAWDSRVAAMRQVIRQFAMYDRGIVNSLRNAAWKDDGRLTAYDGTIIHVLRGARWLRNDKIEDQLCEAKSSIRYLLHLLEKDRLTDQELEEAVKEAGRAVRLLRVVADAIDAFDPFCHPINIGGITRWLRATYDLKAEAPRPDLLRIKERWSDQIIEIRIPAQIGPIDRKPIEQLGAI
jgi:hypothetical protein